MKKIVQRILEFIGLRKKWEHVAFKEIDAKFVVLPERTIFESCIFNGTPQVSEDTWLLKCLIANGSIVSNCVGCIAYGGDYGYDLRNCGGL